MGRKPKFTKFERITIYGKEFRRYPDPDFEAYYRWEKYKYSPESKRDKYVGHIVIPDKLNVAKFLNIFKATRFVANEIVESTPGISRENSIMYTILDFQKGIRFWVDIGMINFSKENKKRILADKNLKIQPGHLIGLFNPKDRDSINRVTFTANIFVPHLKKVVVTSLEDAYKEIDELNFWYDEA